MRIEWKTRLAKILTKTTLRLTIKILELKTLKSRASKR